MEVDVHGKGGDAMPNQYAHEFVSCPRCNSKLQRAQAMNGGLSEFWLKCSRCNTYVNTYIPQPHQRAVHSDSHTFVGNFGGYG